MEEDRGEENHLVKLVQLLDSIYDYLFNLYMIIYLIYIYIFNFYIYSDGHTLRT